MEEHFNELSKDQTHQVCRNLGRLAAANNITQVKLAEHLDYKQGNLSRLFAGKYSPRVEVLFYVLNAINELSGKSFTLKDIDVTEPTETTKNTDQ